jgi:hypothetical protein
MDTIEWGGSGANIFSFVDTFQWIFDCSFATVTTTKFRIYVRDATYGGFPNIDSFEAQIGNIGGGGNNFTIREVKPYCSALAQSTVVLRP